jgi:hypothetical protein
MASASNETLGRMAFTKFAIRNFQMEPTRDGKVVFEINNPFLGLDPTRLTACVERFGWLQLGMAVGYFSASSGELRSIEHEILEAFLPETTYATGHLIALLSSFLGSDRSEFLNPNMPRDDSALQGKFQAALLASEAFDDPLLVALVSEFRNPETSPLDEMIIKFDANEIYAAFNDEYLEWESESKYSMFLAAMSRLICVFQAFADLFPESTNENDWFLEPTFRQAVGTLMSWRVDLDDERTNRRLNNLNASFIGLINFTRFSNMDQFDWRMGTTARSTLDLISHWMKFTDAGNQILHPAP